MKLVAPEPLQHDHIVAQFCSNEPVLDEWLKQRALKNQLNNASRTFVVCDAARRVMGFYCLSAGSVAHSQLGAKWRRNMPNPVPVLVLGRLAVDSTMQGQQLGSALLKDAFLRAKAVSEHIGIKALLVHALNENAKQFYLKRGFLPSPIDDMVLMLPL